jgi:hypothetical protein
MRRAAMLPLEGRISHSGADVKDRFNADIGISTTLWLFLQATHGRLNGAIRGHCCSDDARHRR